MIGPEQPKMVKKEQKIPSYFEQKKVKTALKSFNILNLKKNYFIHFIKLLIFLFMNLTISGIFFNRQNFEYYTQNNNYQNILQISHSVLLDLAHFFLNTIF